MEGVPNPKSHSVEDFLRCVRCDSSFAHNEGSLSSLPCQHAVCCTCLQVQANSGIVTCPRCSHSLSPALPRHQQHTREPDSQENDEDLSTCKEIVNSENNEEASWIIRTKTSHAKCDRDNGESVEDPAWIIQTKTGRDKRDRDTDKSTCRRCTIFPCPPCVSEQHKDRWVGATGSVQQQTLEEMTEINWQLKKMIQDCNSVIATSRKQLNDMNAEKKATTDKIKGLFDGVRRQLDERERAVLKDLDEKARQNCSDLERFLTRQEDLLKDARSVLVQEENSDPSASRSRAKTLLDKVQATTQGVSVRTVKYQMNKDNTFLLRDIVATIADLTEVAADTVHIGCGQGVINSQGAGLQGFEKATDGFSLHPASLDPESNGSTAESRKTLDSIHLSDRKWEAKPEQEAHGEGNPYMRMFNYSKFPEPTAYERAGELATAVVTGPPGLSNSRDSETDSSYSYESIHLPTGGYGVPRPPVPPGIQPAPVRDGDPAEKRKERGRLSHSDTASSDAEENSSQMFDCPDIRFDIRRCHPHCFLDAECLVLSNRAKQLVPPAVLLRSMSLRRSAKPCCFLGTVGSVALTSTSYWETEIEIRPKTRTCTTQSWCEVGVATLERAEANSGKGTIASEEDHFALTATLTARGNRLWLQFSQAGFEMCSKELLSLYNAVFNRVTVGVLCHLPEGSLFFVDADRHQVLYKSAVPVVKPLYPVFRVEAKRDCGAKIRLQLHSGNRIQMHTTKKVFLEKLLR